MYMIFQGNSTKPKLGKQAKFDPAEKAKKAYYNIKQRCTNQKDPNYAAYGGSGIKMLYASCQAFLDDIGLPTAKDASVDRINPKSHYEPGNVRWANKAVQAANKKKSWGGSTPSIPQQIAKCQAIAAQLILRRQQAEAWTRVISLLNWGTLSGDGAKWFDENADLPGLFDWSWDVSDPRDLSEEPGLFRLPSLTIPGEAVTLRGGPIHPRINEDTPMPERERFRSLTKCGVVHWLGKQELLLNVPPKIRDWMAPDLASEEHLGAFWHGLPPAGIQCAGWIEASMLSIACHMVKKGSVCLLLLPVVLAALADRRKAWDFDEHPHPALTARTLFLPDFQVDHTEGWEPDYLGSKDLNRLLDHRIRLGRRTFLGIQDIQKVPSWLRTTILTKLSWRELNASCFNPHPLPSTFPKSFAPRHFRLGGWDLARMQENYFCCSSFTELQGTAF